MCGKPRTPKPPKFTRVPDPPAPAETATNVDKTGQEEEKDKEGRSRQTLQRFDIKLPASFTIPR